MPHRRLPMKHGAALRHKIGLLSRVLQGRGSDSSCVDTLLPELLFRTHCVARASAPLMVAAGHRARQLAPGDAVAARMCEYLEEHIEEEQAHAAWVLSDLEALGCQEADVLARVPPASIAELVGAQYYWIHHVHPVALLAYIAVLEQHVTPPATLAKLVQESRFEPVVFRTLIEHAELDENHVAALYTLIDELPLTASQVHLLSVSAFRTVELLDRAFDEMQPVPPPR